MKPFEFVLVAISVIFGLALTEFATLVGSMINNYETSTFSMPYLLLVLTGVAGGLNYWGTIYLLRNINSWDNVKVGLLFLSGLTYYAVSKVFTPQSNTFDYDYVRFYQDKVSTAFIMMIFWIVLLMIESVVLKKGRNLRWYLTMTGFILLLVSGVLVESNTYRDVLAFVIFGLQILNLTINRVTISESSNA